ncbi:MAG: isocitrate lyase/PEP mutase family protein [Firmicutes bacterium]|nr:isocitrate lyase/PEP mutase family protein [Bacillota bacterium]
MNFRNAGLKERLQQQDILVAPGAPDALIAKIIEKNGFEAVYVTGGGISYTTLGKPDIGLITMSEMVQKASYIAEAVNVPVITDADTGYGNPLNVIRTVKEFERAGVSAIQLEDQVFPKRCGHMAGKALITKEEMVAKIKAAVDARNDENFLIIARTDAIAVGALEEAIERGIAYQEAGADVLFVEAPEEIEEMIKITDSFDIPQLANMVEGGKTPLLSAKELEQIGYKIVIFPNSAVRIMAKAVWELMQEIKTKGTTKHYTDNMFLFDQLNDLLDQNQLQQLEKKYLY